MPGARIKARERGKCYWQLLRAHQVHKTADNSIQNIKQTEKLPAGYTQYHDYT